MLKENKKGYGRSYGYNLSNGKEQVKRRVVCVFGIFGKDTDFVLEPACSDECKCEECKNAFWIEGKVK